MWAQLIKMRIKPGKESEVSGVADLLHSAEQPDSGLIRSLSMIDQKDSSIYYTFVLFESEAKARARESDPRRNELLAAVRVKMAEVFELPPEFVDLNVVDDFGPN
jgi:hypothetical protein